VKRIRVVIVDDHRIVRRAIRALLEREPGIKVVGEAADGRQALAAVARHRPDVLVLDVGGPGPIGLDLARRVRARRPSTEVVVLCMHSHDGDVGEALRVGVAGYVVKTAAPRDLFKAVRVAATGRRYLVLHVPPSWTARAPHRIDPPAELTSRERDVRLLLVRGRSNHDIAAQLGIRPRTVETHRTNLMRKLRTALDRLAAGPFDLVVTDLRMPEMDGPALYREAQLRGYRVPFLFMTGDALRTDLRQFLERTGVPHLVKPFSVQDLLASIAKALAACPGEA
jgi:two-component system, NarL family, response regulator NreC